MSRLCNRDFIPVFHESWLRPVAWTVAPRRGYWAAIVVYTKPSGQRKHLTDSCRFATESAAAEHASSLLKEARAHEMRGRLE